MAAGAVLLGIAFLPTPSPALCAGAAADCDPPSPDFNVGVFLPGLALLAIGWHSLRRQERRVPQRKAREGPINRKAR